MRHACQRVLCERCTLEKMTRPTPLAVMLALALLPCASLAQSVTLTLKAPPDAAKKAGNPAPAKPSATAPADKPLLPDVFDGWVAESPMSKLADATQADSASAAALKEYGFTGGLSATYKRGSETLTIRALGFGDLSGAYGAYTFYRQNSWPKEDIGTGATSDKNRVLFWKGLTVVDATFSNLTSMSASELRDLASALPIPGGNRALPPTILATLPQGDLERQTTHYALGPLGYAGAGGVLPPDLVAFDKGAEETITANYSLRSGPATLTLINYPTPQIAAAQETKIRAYIQAGSKAQPAWPAPLAASDLASLEVRRSGPIVALVSGDAIPEESHKLLQMVHCEEGMTAIPQPTESEVARTSKLLLGIASICIVGGGTAIFLGFMLGGGRALYRIARGKPASSVYETEFIRLNLEK